MNWGHKIIRHIFPIIRLVTIFFVALFLPRFFLQTFKKNGKKDQKQAHVQVVSHHDLEVEKKDKKEEEKKSLLKKLHTLS